MTTQIDEWYYAKEGKAEGVAGPVSRQQLKMLAEAGTLVPTDVVRKRGMTDWLVAEDIRGLFDMPPAPPETAPANKPILWFYMMNDTRRGPITSLDLEQHVRAGRLRPSDFVQRSDQQEWVPFEQVAGVVTAEKAKLLAQFTAEEIGLAENDEEDADAKPLPSRMPTYLLWLYQGTLLLAIVGILGPWYSFAYSFAFAVGYTDGRLSLMGLSITWGKLILVLLLGALLAGLLSKDRKLHTALATMTLLLVIVTATELSYSAPMWMTAKLNFEAHTDTALARRSQILIPPLLGASLNKPGFGIKIGSTQPWNSSGPDWGVGVTLAGCALAVGAAYMGMRLTA